MRIAIEASTWANTRGYGRYTRELTRALLRADTPHRFTLVADAAAADALRDLPTADVMTVHTGRAVVDAATADGSRSPVDMLRIGARLSRGFDAILFPTNYSFVPVLPGRLVAVVIMDAIPETMPELVLGSRRAQILWGLKNRLALAQAHILATLSEASAREIRKHLPVGNREMTILSGGAAAAFSAEPAPNDVALVRSAVPVAAPYLLFVGGISPHKRVAELIRAYGEVIAGGGHDTLQLVLAGPDGRDQFASDQLGVGQAIASLGAAAQRVIRTGFVSDDVLAALYRGATCVVLPSIVEGLGLPAVEAMTSGTPVIAARTPALQEVCGDAAEFVDDLSTLPATIRRLIDDDTRRATLRRLGLARAQTFGWNGAAQRLLDAFDRYAR